MESNFLVKFMNIIFSTRKNIKYFQYKSNAHIAFHIKKWFFKYTYWHLRNNERNVKSKLCTENDVEYLLDWTFILIFTNFKLLNFLCCLLLSPIAFFFFITTNTFISNIFQVSLNLKFLWILL